MSRKHINGNAKTESRKVSVISGEVSLGKIIDTLTPSQVWTLIGITFMVLSGTFGLGYKLKSSIAQSEIANVQVEVSTLKAELNELHKQSDVLSVANNELEAKERFLTFYIRYMDAKGASEKSPSNQKIQSERREAAENLINFIKEQLSHQDFKGNVSKFAPVMRVGIGRTPLESVIIFNDGTKWSIPEEIAKSFKLAPILS